MALGIGSANPKRRIVVRDERIFMLFFSLCEVESYKSGLKRICWVWILMGSNSIGPSFKRAPFSSARARNAEILFWIGDNFRLSAILSEFSEVTATEPLLLRKNREDIEYGTQE